MIKYLFLFLINFSFANADDCPAQFKEFLQANKDAFFVNCFVVNDKPLTITALQIYALRDNPDCDEKPSQKPSGVTLSTYITAQLKRTPDHVISCLGDIPRPFMFNDKIIPAGLFADVDKDDQKEIVISTLTQPKALSVYIFSWDKENRKLKAESRSMLHGTSVDYFAGSYIPGTKNEYPRLSLDKKTFLIPYETYGKDHNVWSYKVYKLIGPLYVSEDESK